MIPWSHNTLITVRIKNEKQKMWYIKEIYNNGCIYDYNKHISNNIFQL